MMLNASALIAQCLLALAGFASLCLATPRHATQLKHGASLNRFVRLTGWVLLFAATTVAIASEGWSLGVVTLFGALTLSALVVVGVATYWPRGLTYLVLAGLIGSAGLGAYALITLTS